MRGLIEKDLRLTAARKQTIGIFFGLALIMGMSMDGSFLVGYLTMFSTILAIGTISYDEFDNGFEFLMTLPFERKTYVREKYLFCFMMEVAAWCAGIVLYFIGSVIRPGEADLAGELPMLTAIIPVMYLSAAVMIPLQLKYGSEKSRVVLFGLFGLIAIVLYGTKTVSDRLGNPFRSLEQILDACSPAVVLVILSAVCALITAACYLWSIRVIGEKEF